MSDSCNDITLHKDEITHLNKYISAVEDAVYDIEDDHKYIKDTATELIIVLRTLFASHHLQDIYHG